MEIKTIPNRFPETNTLVVLSTPVAGICPHSNEPQTGSSIRVSYRPKEDLIELHGIEGYLQEIQKLTEPMDLETLIQLIAQDCYTKVGWVEVVGTYKLANGLELDCTVTME